MIVPDYREFKHSNELYHYGMPRRSGRYPFGSGDRPYQTLKNKANLVRLNAVNTKKEYYNINKKFLESYYKNHPILSKIPTVKLAKKIYDFEINRYSKYLDKYLEKLNDSEVKLSYKNKIKHYGNFSWIGNKYYI